MRKRNDLRAPRVMLGQCPSGSGMLHSEHVERNRPSDSLRPFEDRVPVGDRNLERLFDKINLTHATPAFDSRPGKSIRAAATLRGDERLTSINNLARLSHVACPAFVAAPRADAGSLSPSPPGS